VNRAEQRLRKALDGFLDAFRNLDLSLFITFFDAEATVFFPFEVAPWRAKGIEEITAIFSAFFMSVRSRHPDGPPYLPLDPLVLQIAMTANLALVSFHLKDMAENQSVLCRRTFVWVDDGIQWRILHLHASNLPLTRTSSEAPGNSGAGKT